MICVLEFGHWPHRSFPCTSSLHSVSMKSVVVEIFTLQRSANTTNQKFPLPLATQKAGY